MGVKDGWVNLTQVATGLIKATGATSMVAAPGSDLSLAILKITANVETTTTGFQELTMGEHGGSLNFRTYGQTAFTNIVNYDFTANPWILSSNVAFDFTMSVTAASTPGIEVTVMYRTMKRRWMGP